MGILFAIAFGVVIAIVGYVVAKGRNRNAIGWAI